MTPQNIRSITMVRHGMTEWAAAGQHTSVTDIDLTEQGRAEAKELWQYFANGEHHFDGVYTSPLRRAHHTAILAGFAPQVYHGLFEWRYGRYEGKTTAEIHQENPQWTIFRCGAPEGETTATVQHRCEQLLQDWEQAGQEHVLCFAHGHILRALACCWLGLGLEFGDHLHLDAASISRLGWEHISPAIELWNQRLQK
ncbi:histidine phosphatase family protein [Acidithiobacillus caldus]|uniref:histidine phosphatase family protein n=1 Tax=Acidithiobacillus caldus TaxID=33059 RepID=UPI001C073D41|nr:histidine phosphatase family protein [Acidithiobacillus caldus]MBU2762231.1 histidine phosphatase family protein [Acidithiobacillus caldus]MBU2770497.1 histidine phosphatase family protein [Acidithiobacillus caldus]